MLGRKGCKWSYDETVIMESEVQADMAYDVIVAELEKYKDFEAGHVVLSIEILANGIPALRLQESQESTHIVRFITDGKRIGVNVRCKKPKQSQVYVPVDESL